MALDLSKFIERFTGEAREHLAVLEAGLSMLGQEPLGAERIDALFRSAHTIKGSARMLKLSSIAETAHHLEDVLAGLREGRLTQDAALARLMLRAVDALTARVDALQQDGQDAAKPDQALHTALAAAAAGEPVEGGASDTAAPDAGQADSEPVPVPAQQASLRTAESVRVPLLRLDELIVLLGELVVSLSEQRRLSDDAHALARQARALSTAPSAWPAGLDQTSEPRQPPGQEQPPGQGQPPGQAQAPASRTALTEHAVAARDLSRALRADLQARELLTEMLGERALALRMMPLSMVFDPAVRMVRELSRQLGKEVRCEARGAELELDRHIIDKLGDCLLHCLRNAVDHGLEDAAERRAAGKDAVGRVRLSARHAGSGLIIEVSDDGRGLSRERILAKAIKKGLIEPPQAEQLSDDQIFGLVFQPGFSTSEIITDLSGRGVGLDVVKSVVVDELHGALSLSSRAGLSTTFTIKLPLTLALMRVLVLQSDARRFAFNAQHVVEMIRVEPKALQLIAGRPALVLRNELIPVIPLGELLELGGGHVGSALQRLTGMRPRSRARLVVIIGVQASKLGVAVEALVDQCDLVIKPLPTALRGCHLVGGVVRMSGNELVSVLQAPTLIERARHLRGESAIREAAARPVTAKVGATRRHLLVVDDSLNTREIEKELLEAHGFRVTTAEDGLDAWQKAHAETFDAVLTDVEMPRLDGFSLTAKLRTLAAYRITPIIIVTSRQKEQDRRRGIEVGADAYIVKGDFDQTSLLETLSNLLG